MDLDEQDNILNLEKDIEMIKYIIYKEDGSRSNYIDIENYSDEKLCENFIIAIEHLLADYTRQKQINEEHQKENGLLREKVKELEKQIKYDINHIFTPKTIELNFIPKQKIIDRFEETQKLYEEKLRQIDLKEVRKIDIEIFKAIKLEIKRGLLRELLQESEDK